MTDYEIADQERKRFWDRKELVKAQMKDITDPEELERQKKRYSILEAMYEEALLRMETARPPKDKKRRTPKRLTSLYMDGFLESDTTCRGEAKDGAITTLDGTTVRWTDFDINTTNEQKAQLKRALKRGRAVCSERQQKMLDLAMTGKSVTQIAKDLGVDKSTVSRTLHRSYKRIREFEQINRPGSPHEDGRENVRRTVIDLSDPQNIEKLLGCLTERQAVYLYLYYGEWLSMRDIGKLLNVDHSTVCRALQRASYRIRGCYPETAQIEVLDLSSLGDTLYALYQQPQVQELVPDCAREAAERANAMCLQKRENAPDNVPFLQDSVDDISACEKFSLETSEENLAESDTVHASEISSPIIRFYQAPYKSPLWHCPFRQLISSSRLLSKLVAEAEGLRGWRKGEYASKRLGSLVSSFCNKISTRVAIAIHKLSSKSA